ncbi:mannose-1-phosphate guanylyltransferase [Cohnella zeiphila]|uniref:Mannose-1-phosphate guanylyltransferase n=1 Tax=Cohnella zeiphila TaxID=2761120 RepID=A0A7X0SMR1_9BACL|nr:sugar phosphate nucleotidyltransferase [Cohnella zeiphila]MBB6732716.1 mannose-1-phosphate guanylyltransferase [Cohnella zeiphila]
MKIVIMAGGKGTRSWPRSIDDLPKQFLPFLSEQTLIQETVNRFRDFVPASHLFIAMPRHYLPLLNDQLPNFSPNQLIIEPQQKDTAACIALTVYRFLQSGDDEPVAFVPSDQFIADKEAFLASISEAADVAFLPDAIVTLGVRPDRAESGFGYLLTVPDSNTGRISSVSGIRRVARFLEKPDDIRAQQLMSEPDIYWNSGILVCRPETMARCIQSCEPTLWNPLLQNTSDPDAAYADMPRLSIDYAVLEKARTIYCLPVNCGWDDIGSWGSLLRHLSPDPRGNVIRGEVNLMNAVRNLVYVDDRKAVIIGVSDLIVASTSNGLLICPKSEEPRLKKWLSAGTPPPFA